MQLNFENEISMKGLGFYLMMPTHNTTVQSYYCNEQEYVHICLTKPNTVQCTCQSINGILHKGQNNSGIPTCLKTAFPTQLVEVTRQLQAETTSSLLNSLPVIASKLSRGERHHAQKIITCTQRSSSLQWRLCAIGTRQVCPVYTQHTGVALTGDFSARSSGKVCVRACVSAVFSPSLP